jgi:hypothetical protein
LGDELATPIGISMFIMNLKSVRGNNMSNKKNIPDRIKLVVQLIVFTFGTWLLMTLVLLISGLPFSINNVDWSAFWVLLLPVSFIIQTIRFAYKWKELVKAEKAGEFPDLQNINNMTPFQSVFILIGILLLVSGVLLFALYSKLAGVLCLMVYVLLWGYDAIYQKKRMQNIMSDNGK